MLSLVIQCGQSDPTAEFVKMGAGAGLSKRASVARYSIRNEFNSLKHSFI